MIMNEITVLLISCIPAWILALYMWTRHFWKGTSNRLSWLSVFFLWLPPVFFILCAFSEKESEKRKNIATYQTAFRLRLSICLCCWAGELVTSYLLKFAGVEWYAEIATASMNIILSLLIVTSWNMLNRQSATL